MKRLLIGSMLFVTLAIPALAEPPAPATSPSPPVSTAAANMADLRPATLGPVTTHRKKAVASPHDAPANLFPLSIQQQQDAQRQLLDETFHIDHSG